MPVYTHFYRLYRAVHAGTRYLCTVCERRRGGDRQFGGATVRVGDTLAVMADMRRVTFDGDTAPERPTGTTRVHSCRVVVIIYLQRGAVACSGPTSACIPVALFHPRRHYGAYTVPRTAEIAPPMRGDKTCCVSGFNELLLYRTRVGCWLLGRRRSRCSPTGPDDMWL